MTFFPDSKTLVSLGPLSIRWYAVCILTGAFLAYWVAWNNLKKKGYTKDQVDDIFIGCLVSGVIGARLYYVLFYDLPAYLAHPASIFNIMEGGLAIHGGLIGGVLFALYYCRKHHLSFLFMADEALYCLLLAQAIGRVGNFINQEAYGPIVSEEFFTYLPHFIKEGMYIQGAYRMPMFYFEMVANLIGFALIHFGLHQRKNYKPGDLVYAYGVWYGMVRFFIEIFRTDALLIGSSSIKIAQVFSIVLVVVGLAGLLGLFRKLFPKLPSLLFDLDGTVMDSRMEIESTFRAYFKDHPPVYEVTDEKIYSLVGPTLVETFQEAYPDDDPSQVQNRIAAFNDYRKAFKDTLKPMPTVMEVLSALKEKGYRMGVVSNKQTFKIEEVCKDFGLDAYFSVMVGSDLVEKGKPDPQGLLLALDGLGRPYDNALYIGDTEADLKAADAAGLVGVGYQLSGGPVRIEDYHVLEDLLKEEKQWTKYTM